MIGQRSEGYTIIEVSLFLGISALMLALAFVGTGLSIRTTRFADSTRSLHGYVQQQYDDLLNGVNTRAGEEACDAGTVDTGTAQTPGTSNCLLMGKLMVFKPNVSQVVTYNVVGTEPLNPDYTKSDEELIYDFSPTVVSGVGVDTYQIPWQATLSGSKRVIDSVGVDAFALIRSPRSPRIVSYTFKEPGATYNLKSLINPNLPADTNNISKASNFCLLSADGIGMPSKITTSGGQGQDSIGVSFDAASGDCDGS